MKANREAPRVAALVVNYNDGAYLLDCLRSLEGSDYPNLDVIVVDNASSDGSAYAARSAFPAVRWICNKKNAGFARGNNLGIRRALREGAAFVFLLNPDATVAPATISRLVEVASSDVRIGMCGPKIRSAHDRARLWCAGMVRRVPPGKIFPHFLMRGYGEIDDARYDRLEEVVMLPACALLVRRSVVERIGGFDERFFLYGEDSDWCDRTRAAGLRIVYVPDATVWHVGGVCTGGPSSAESWFYTVRNQLFFFRKRTGLLGWPRLYADYLRENLWFSEGFQRKGDEARAAATADGMWAALMNRSGRRLRKAPSWFLRWFHSMAHISHREQQRVPHPARSLAHA